MEIGDKILIKGEVTEIRQTKEGYLIKVKPDYDKEHADLEKWDNFIVHDSSIINQTDEINELAEYYLRGE